MKIQHTSKVEAETGKVETGHSAETSVVNQHAARVLILLFLLLAALSASAQPSYIRFNPTQERITVPLNSTNSNIITNSVNLSGGATNANFDVSGLPAGAGYVLTDNNGNTLTNTTMDTNLWVTVNTTNIPEGLYLFRLNAGGFDTNGLPVTNSFPFVLQSAYIWNGALNTSSNWNVASSWLGGGVPGAADDVVFTDTGAQTNNFATTTGISFTNSVVTANMTIGSLRFAQTGVTNLIATNPPPYFHHVQITNGATLTIAGTRGFSLMRDYFDDAAAGLNTMNVTIAGPAAKLIISNQSATVTAFVGGGLIPTLDMSNLDTCVVNVSRVGIADYQLYPNYMDLNTALNVGRDTNTYSGRPRQMSGNIYLAKTNTIFAGYKDPSNYTNEYSRGYAFTLFNNEQSGVGSSTVQQLQLGITNTFLVDGVCFFGASGNGTVRYWPSNAATIFRNTNGTSALSVFTVSDDGGTNEAASNIKGIADFSQNNGIVDILVDRLYLARDRELIGTNQTPNVQADLLIGRGNLVASNAVFGFQEHTKPDWTVIGGGQPYLNYCQGRLTVTNGGTVKILGTLTLGYTADTNSSADAEQYGTYGQITIYSNSTVMVSNIVVDGGLNFYDPSLNLPGSTHRINTITINGSGNLIVSNSIGGNNYTGSLYPTFLNPGLPCLPLDTLTMAPSSILTLFVSGKTNVYVRNFSSTGTGSGIIKIASLPPTPFYPTNIALIAYSTATPVLAADMSAIGGSVQGYILNDTVDSTINLLLTTNAPKTLLWTGSANGNWNLTDLNWVTVPGGFQTNFADGDIVTFDDSSSRTNVTITDVVVPNQAATNNGVTITNSTHIYTFSGSGGGLITGTARILKQGTNDLVFNAIEAGPITITAGEVDVQGSGSLGTATFYSNTVLNVLSGGSVSSLTATNATVTVANGGTISAGVVLAGGSLVNSGTVSSGGSGAFTLNNNAVLTNNTGATILLGPSTAGAPGGYEVLAGSTLENSGNIKAPAGRLFLNGLYYGPGNFFDPNSPGAASSSLGRFVMRDNFNATISPGPSSTSATGAIGDMYIGGRLDLASDNNSANNSGTLLVEVGIVGGSLTNDTITATRWNNIGCLWLITNLNSTFSSGQSFPILNNANGLGLPNYVDTSTIYPMIQPTVPGPGLEWNLTGIQQYGTVMVTNCTMIWDGNGDQTWNTNGSANVWQSGKIYGDYQGSVFDDTASGTTTVTLTTPVAPAGFNVVTNTAGSTAANFITNSPAFLPGLVVSNSAKDYIFVANNPTNRITGLATIYKTGPGTMTLLTSNDFSGGVVVDGGTFAFTNVNALGHTPGQTPAYFQMIFDNNATMRFFGASNQSLGRLVTIKQNGATLEVSNSTSELTMNQAILGSGVLTKTGLGALVLSSASDIYGGTVVNAGTVRLTTTAAGSNSITLNNSGVLQLTNAFTLTNSISVAGPSTAITLQGVATNVDIGSWSGTGSVTMTSANPTTLFVFNNDLSGFSGTLSLGSSVSLFRFNNSTNSNPCTGSAAATFDLGTGSATLFNLNGSNLVYNLGALAGGPNTTLSGRSTNIEPAGTIYRIGANGSNTTFSGRIVDGLDPSVSIVKVGNGTLLLNGNSTYTGSTTVSNGVLGGTGSIASPLTVVSTGTLSPGAPIGTFTVSNNATLGGTVLMELNQANLPANDELVVTGAVTATGTLVVTNVGPDIYNNSTFKLFSKAVSGFASVTLPAKDPSNIKTYNWNNNLSVDGTIQLASGGAVNPQPTNINYSVSGNTLTLSWPADHTGWRLQAQTNTLSVGISNNWADVSGSTNVDSVAIPINVNNPTVFYRMIYP